MQPLTEGQMQEFIRAYVPDQAEAMLRQLNDRLREFGQTPLLLWMLCEVFQQSPEHQMPSNLAGIFQAFTRMYEDSSVRKHEVALLKGDVRPLSDRRLWKPALQTIAATMMEGETKVDFRRVIPRHEAERELSRIFLNEKLPVRDILDDLLKYHLLQNRSADQIEFRHHLIQEYYAAEYLLRLLPELSDKHLKRDYLNLLKWTEPIALMLALVNDEAQALRVVKLAMDDVDLILGARLSGEVVPSLSSTTVGWINDLNIPTSIKVQSLETNRSEAAVEALCKFLRTSDKSWERRSVIEALGKIGDRAAVQDLCQVLRNSDDSWERRSVVEALGKIGDRAAVQDLCNFLRTSDDSWERRSVVEALGKIGDRAAIPDLCQVLRNSSDYFWEREDTFRALGALGLNVLIEFGLEEAIMHLCRHVYGPYGEGDPYAAGLLAEIGDKTVIETLSRILNCLEGYPKQGKVFRDFAEPAFFLRRIGSEAAVEVLYQAIENSNRFVRLNAAFNLVKIGYQAAVPTLCESLEELDDSCNDIKMGVVVALGEFGYEAAVPTLKRVLQDPSYYLHFRAAYALARIGTEEAVEALYQTSDYLHPEAHNGIAFARDKIRNEAVIGALCEALNHSDVKVRLRAACALSKIGIDIVIKSLCQALKHPENYGIRRRAAEALGIVCTETTLEIFRQTENYLDTDVYRNAIETLSKTGRKAAIKALIKAAIEDEEHGVIRIAVEALGQLNTKVAIPVLHRTLIHSRFSIHRRNASQALIKFGTEADIEFLRQFLNDPDDIVRFLSTIVLAITGDETAISILPEFLKHENSKTQSEASEFLEMLFDEAAIPKLRQWLENLSPGIRDAAVRALDKVRRVSHQVMIPKLLDALKDEDVRYRAEEVLEKLSDESAIPALLEALKDEEPRVRDCAAEVLGKLGSRAAIPALLEALKDEDVSDSAAEALGKLSDESAIPALLEALKDEDYSGSKSTVAEALGKVGSPDLLVDLWQIHRQFPEDDLEETISAIQDRCKFYNYEIFHDIIPPGKTISLYFSYAPADEALQTQLTNHLTLLERQGIITSWSQRQILPGDEPAQVINKQLNTADIILLLISANSFADDTCYNLEIQRAIERHQAGEARIIPILLRPVNWAGAPFSQLEVLPKNHQPVTTWADQDEAFCEIAEGIRAVAMEVRKEKVGKQGSRGAGEIDC
jgi:HEAT repeat protein